MTTLVFDIETIPDVELGRRVFGLEGLADELAHITKAHVDSVSTRTKYRTATVTHPAARRQQRDPLW